MSGINALAAFPYSGHRQLLQKKPCPGQNTAEVLRYFSDTPTAAREKYVAFVADGIAQGKRADLIGGGLIRSSGGWQEVKWAQKAGVFLKSDERILGDSDFVEAVLELEREDPGINAPPSYNLQDVAARVAEVLGLEESDVLRKGKHPASVRARSLLCYWATRKLGMTTVALAKIVEMSQPAVSRAAERGEELAKANGWKLADEGNA